MSDAAEPHSDPWAQACAEDLAAERARRRAAGQGDTSREAVESLRGFLHRLAGEANRLGPVAGLAAREATAALDPVLDRHRDTVSHLARAGDELAAACRAVLDTATAPSPDPSADASGAPATEGSAERGDSRPPRHGESEDTPDHRGTEARTGGAAPTGASNTSPEASPADAGGARPDDGSVDLGKEPDQPDQPGTGA